MFCHVLRAAAIIPCLSVAAFALEATQDPRLAGYRQPAGWKVEIAASEPIVINPVTMTFGNDGRLYVAEWKTGRGPNDLIKVLTDTNGDGSFDKADIFMDNLDLPAGILFWDGWVYITLEHDVVRFKDRDGDGKFEIREVIASGFGNDNSHHRVSGMTLGPDGWLYLTTGDSDAHAKGSDGSNATVLRCGGVFRCKPDGSHMENFAFGMRNPWGNVAFDDEFNIFHTDNDNEGSPGFTGCRLLHVVEGGDYGWRLREGARCCAPDFDRATWNGGRPGRLGWMTETGRGAPAGLCVLNSAAFPPSTRNLLVYPDVFRKLVRGYKLKPAGATYTVAEEIELLGSDEGLFRPTDAEVGPDGALYILDWRTDSGGAGQLSGNGTTGRIYRMTWIGTKAEPARPTFPRDRFVKVLAGDDSGLIEALKSDDYGMRRVASTELIRRSGADQAILRKKRDRVVGTRIDQGLDSLRKLIRDDESTGYAALHATAVLTAKGGEASAGQQLHELLVEVYKNRPARNEAASSLRRLVINAIERTQPFESNLGIWLLLMSKAENDPEVLRAQALAFGRFRGPRHARNDDQIVKRDFGHELQRELNEASKNGLLKNQRNELTHSVERKYQNLLCSDVIAHHLLKMGVKNLNADPFLRDGITRGLEGLGPAGVDAVVKALASGDTKMAQVALYTLEGWRTDSALGEIIATATSSSETVSDEVRVQLFHSLREMVTLVPPEPLVRWVVASKGRSSTARVQALKVLTAMHQRAVLAAGPALAGLIGDPDPEVRRAVLILAREIRSEDAKDALVALVKNESNSGDERSLALSALRGYDGLDLAPMAVSILPVIKDPGLKLEVLRTLAGRDFPTAAKLAEGLLNESNRELRHEAILLLGSKPDTALAVAQRYNAGSLPREDLSRVIDAIRPHATPELQTTLQALLKKTLLAAPSGDEARRFRDFVARNGDPARGKTIYLDAKKGGCTTCHRLEGVGGAVGPDLTRIWETLSFDKRVESILEPSKEIKEGFATFKVATKNGQVLTGLLLADTPEGVTLMNAEGREVRIPAQDVDEKGTDKTSLMPAGVVGHLSLNELADLLAFLGDRGAQERLRPTGSK